MPSYNDTVAIWFLLIEIVWTLLVYVLIVFNNNFNLKSYKNSFPLKLPAHNNLLASFSDKHDIPSSLY